MAKKVLDVVRGAGLLTAIFSSLAKAVEMLGGTEEDLHRLSTPEGEKTIELMAEVAVRSEPRLGDLAMRPGMCIFYYEHGGLISFGDGSGHPFYWRRLYAGWGKDDKRIVDFLRSKDDFRRFAVMLANMFEFDIKPTDTSVLGFEFVKPPVRKLVD